MDCSLTTELREIASWFSSRFPTMTRYASRARWLTDPAGLRSSGTALISLIVLVLTAVPSAGQIEPEGGVVFELSYSNPGARSMGFGGAFTALADDATAAVANPSGLVQIVRPEASVELRHREFATEFTRSGRIDGEPTGIGLDTAGTIRTGTSTESLRDLSFVSVVLPWDRWAIAVYRHQLVSFDFEGGTQGLFGNHGSCCGDRFGDQLTETRFDIVGYGLSGAYRFGERLDVGVGVSHFVTRIDGYSALFRSPGDDPFGGNPYRLTDLIADNTVRADATSQGLHGGFLWNVSPRFHLGGFYREGPEATVSLVATIGSDVISAPDRTMRFPDVYGAGISYRSVDGRLTLALEWDRIEYATIVESLQFSDLTLDDGNELHAGGEYVMLDWDPVVAFRLGAWRDPDHRTRYVGDDPFKAALHPSGNDEFHVSVGFGIAFRLFQIDIGIDLSDPVDTMSMSGIYSF